MRRVLLDTHQWNYLVAPDEHPGLGCRLDEVRRAVRSGVIEIVGTLDILQELIAAAPRREQKYRQMADVFFELSANRLLIPLSRRHPAEACQGGLLDESNRYFPRESRRSFKAMAASQREPLEVAEEIYAEAETYRLQEIAAREEIRARMNDANERLNERSTQAWWDDLEIDDWVAPTVDAGVRRGLYKSEHVEAATFERYPSAWTFTAYRLARLKIVIGGGEGSKIRASDLADAHHVSCGPYVDLIVSDDVGLRTAFDLFADQVAFIVIGAAEFNAEFGLMPPD